MMMENSSLRTKVLGFGACAHERRRALKGCRDERRGAGGYPPHHPGGGFGRPQGPPGQFGAVSAGGPRAPPRPVPLTGVNAIGVAGGRGGGAIGIRGRGGFGGGPGGHGRIDGPPLHGHGHGHGHAMQQRDPINEELKMRPTRFRPRLFWKKGPGAVEGLARGDGR